jgi:hypothetical protein
MTNDDVADPIGCESAGEKIARRPIADVEQNTFVTAVEQVT